MERSACEAAGLPTSHVRHGKNRQFQLGWKGPGAIVANPEAGSTQNAVCVSIERNADALESVGLR